MVEGEGGGRFDVEEKSAPTLYLNKSDQCWKQFLTHA